MELFETIEKRYSCRNFNPVEIPDEDIEKILDAGRRAASGCNRQPFGFLVIKDKKNMEKIATVQEFMPKASMAIGLVADPAVSDYWLEDISAAATQMLLAITALGYGSTWVEGMLLLKEEEMKKHFGIPENLRFAIVLPIGAPKEGYAQPVKKALSEMTHWEKW
ncbi:MAG: nitroreductase family protein [Phycisphaerae bacterium]|nr:nitroreductase family protein [Phycisphaerae bacterium]